MRKKILILIYVGLLTWTMYQNLAGNFLNISMNFFQILAFLLSRNHWICNQKIQKFHTKKKGCTLYVQRPFFEKIEIRVWSRFDILASTKLFGHASNNQDLTENSTIPFYISSYLLLEQIFMCWTPLKQVNLWWIQNMFMDINNHKLLDKRNMGG
jgi:hypothetical protein